MGDKWKHRSINRSTLLQHCTEEDVEFNFGVFLMLKCWLRRIKEKCLCMAVHKFCLKTWLTLRILKIYSALLNVCGWDSSGFVGVLFLYKHSSSCTFKSQTAAGGLYSGKREKYGCKLEVPETSRETLLKIFILNVQFQKMRGDKPGNFRILTQTKSTPEVFEVCLW